MKSFIFSIVLVFSASVMANPSLGEADLKDCECKTCLIENGVCIRTQTNGDRYVPDKSSSSKPKKGKANASGAVKG